MRNDAVLMPCADYLARLPLPPEARERLLAQVDAGSPRSPREAMAALHRLLAGGSAAAGVEPALASVAARLRLLGAEPDDAQPAEPEAPVIAPVIAPPVCRSSMVPHPWGTLNPLLRWWRGDDAGSAASRADRAARDTVDSPDPRGDWQHNGNVRRLVLLVLMLAQTAMATWFMGRVLPYQGTRPLEMATMALFAILFCWVSAGFWTAMAGFLVLLRGSDRYVISRRGAPNAPIDAAARTAIVMPIANEDVTRVMAGLRATYESVAATGELDRFDFFVLSDSNDPDLCSAELAAWASLCRAVDGFGRIFYRRRRRRVKRKSGNIDDFCRRWGKNYRYMVVLDADSVMSGDCLTTLVRLMEANPGAGIIQTAPLAAGRDTLYARIQQFATRVYGPLFTAGLHYWQLGESHYWGHNAIIRVAPFIAHCALAPLPGRGSLAGEILSHDFVEAALMRRAGWSVWIAYDLDGSYEEMPPNLLDELKRDRRWCHGNLMNFRLFGARGMHPVHRAVFVTGVMAYLSAPLWFGFLVLSSVMLALHALGDTQYFTQPRQLFPIWPQWHPEQALALFSATATLLFLPKILAVVLIWLHGARRFGGAFKVAASMLIELLFSMLLAPVRMLFHARFVVAAFLGWEVRWKSPPRGDAETTWGEAVRKHGLQTLLGLVWGAAVYRVDPFYLPWLLPITGALVLSIPISVFSSRVSLGRRFRDAGLFVIPEETRPPAELVATDAYVDTAPPLPSFADAVTDPLANALACASGIAHVGVPPQALAARDALADETLRAPPDALPPAHQLKVLNDPVLLSRLHLDVWSGAAAHEGWRRMTGREPAAALPAAA